MFRSRCCVGDTPPVALRRMLADEGSCCREAKGLFVRRREEEEEERTGISNDE